MLYYGRHFIGLSISFEALGRPVEALAPEPPVGFQPCARLGQRLRVEAADLMLAAPRPLTLRSGQSRRLEGRGDSADSGTPPSFETLPSVVRRGSEGVDKV